MAIHIKQDGILSQGQRLEPPAGDHSTPELAHVEVFGDLLERVGLTRPLVAVSVGGVLYVLYLLGVYLDGFNQVLSRFDFWKSSLEPPAILAYALLIHRLLDIYGRRAVQALRPVISVDDAAFARLVARMSATIMRYQWVAMVVSSALSVVVLAKWEDWSDGFRWTALAASVTSLAEYAVLGSAIYLVVARNRFFTQLFKQPLKLNVFDPAPVRPMGRWGLSVSTAIMGGITISVLLVGGTQDLLSVEHLPAYLVATSAAILAFFASLFSAHRVLVQAKEKELSAIRGKLSDMYGELWRSSEGRGLSSLDRLDSTNDANGIATWLGYERRIADAQEWPYTANTLSGLLATVLFPIAVTVIQQIILRW